MTLERTIILGATLVDDPIKYEAREWRGLVDALVTAEGVYGPDDFRVTPRAEGANQSVDILAGLAAVAGETSTAQGKYVQRNNDKVNFTDIPAPPSTGTKAYYLYLKINDKQTDTAVDSYDPLFVCGPDTSGVPANALFLAIIARHAGQASVLAGDITDRRPRMQGQPNLQAYAEFWGGNGQPIPRRVLKRYRPFGVRFVTGFTVGAGGNITDPTQAILSAPWGGLFDVTANLVSNIAGPATLIVRRTSPSLGDRRLIGPGSPNASVDGQTSTLAAVSGQIACARDDTLECLYEQDAVGTSNLNDSGVVLQFTVSYRGPLPGLF